MLRKTAILIVCVISTFFVLMPLMAIIVMSFLSTNDTSLVSLPLNIHAYLRCFNPLYLKLITRSVGLALMTTWFTLLLAFPFAWSLRTTAKKFRALLLLLLIIPLWTSSLVRTYALMAIIKAHGPLNNFLIWLGIIDQPLQILYSNTAVVMGCVYSLFPFMALPLVRSVEKIDERVLEAARDLGANGWTMMTKIKIPLSLPGMLTGSVFVFLPSMTLFYIPDLLGSSKLILLGNLIQNKFLIALNWPLGASICVLLMVAMALLFGVYCLIERYVHGKAKSRLVL